MGTATRLVPIVLAPLLLGGCQGLDEWAQKNTGGGYTSDAEHRERADREFLETNTPVAKLLSDMGYRVGPAQRRLDAWSDLAELRENVFQFFDTNNTSKQVLQELVEFFSIALNKASKERNPEATEIGGIAYGLSDADQKTFTAIISHCQEALGGSIRLTGDRPGGLSPLFAPLGPLDIDGNLAEVSSSLATIIAGNSGALSSTERGDALQVAAARLDSTVATMTERNFRGEGASRRDGTAQDLEDARNGLNTANANTPDSNLESVKNTVDRAIASLASMRQRGENIVDAERPLNIYSLGRLADTAKLQIASASNFLAGNSPIPNISLSGLSTSASSVESDLIDIQAKFIGMERDSRRIGAGHPSLTEVKNFAGTGIINATALVDNLEELVNHLRALNPKTGSQAEALKLFEAAQTNLKIILENLRAMQINDTFAFKSIKPAPKQRARQAAPSVQALLAQSEFQANGGNRVRFNQPNGRDFAGRMSRPNGLATGKSRGVHRQNPNHRGRLA